MDNTRKFEQRILNLIPVKRYSRINKIATNQSLNLSPIVSTLGLFIADNPGKSLLRPLQFHLRRILFLF